MIYNGLEMTRLCNLYFDFNVQPLLNTIEIIGTIKKVTNLPCTNAIKVIETVTKN